MSDQEMVAARAAGEDVLGQRGFFANVDRARAFGGNSLSGLLDIAGGLVLVVSLVMVTILLVRDGAGGDDDWMLAGVMAVLGATSGLMLFALSRLVTYVKACAVLLAKSSAEHAGHIEHK
jgi:hypothetical protein